MQTTVFRVGMQSVNPLCRPLRDTIRVRLLRLYCPDLTGNEDIDGPKQFGTSTFLPSYRKSWSILNDLNGR